MITEYWQVQCPRCLVITYYQVVIGDSYETCWPFLNCRGCKKYHLKTESDLCVFTVCEKIDQPTELQKRQSVTIYLERPNR